MSDDPFKKAPEFLAAFANVVENGFFDVLDFNVHCFDGTVSNCNIQATGLVPNDAKYEAKGCGALVDPKDVVEKLRTLFSSRKLSRFSVEVKSENWPLWDEEEENIIGSKGTKTTLSLLATFKL